MRLIPRTPAEVIGPWLERAQVALLLFPAGALLWFGPKAPLAGDPNPELTGAAIAAFAVLPSISMALLRRAAPRAPWVLAFLAFVLIGLASRALHPPSDTLEADRACMLATVALAALLGGASLGSHGRATLVRALPLLTALALLPALFDGDGHFAGALGNTGSTSEVAVLGAIAGAWLFAHDEGGWRWYGGAVVALHAVYCGLAPVLSGAIVLATGLAVLFVLAGQRKRVVALAVVCAVVFFGERVLVGNAPAPASDPATASTSGAQVRELIWRRSLTLIGDYAVLGAGPGQFAAAFPPYRDPREIELSTHGRALVGVETEVEHAHSDWLQGFADTGTFGGLAWIAFLGAVAWTSWRALRLRDTDRAALGTIALGVLINALLREPLSWNPASSCTAFAVFGALIGANARNGPLGLARRSWLFLALAAVVVQIPRAWSVCAHGRALAGYVRTHRNALLDFALESCPDSIDARTLDARRIEARTDERAIGRVIDGWRSVLAIRPHRFEALAQLGKACATDGRLDEARAAWKHALALDPENPMLPRNFARMEALIGDVDEAQHWCELAHYTAAEAFKTWATEALLALDVERGWQLLARAEAQYAGLDADRAYQLARAAAPGRDALALEGSAHVAWAREHAAARRFEDAVRSYRQAKRCLNVEVNPNASPRWSPRLRLELAAALELDGKRDDASRELEGVVQGSRDWLALPPWAGEALLHAGLLAR